MEIAGVFNHYDHSGPAAMALCILMDGATLVTLGNNGATASVVVHTFDRYWKIVHPIHHRKFYRRWMLYVGLFLPWLDGAAVHLLPAIGTTKIVDGICHPTAYWPSPSMRTVCTLLSYSLAFYPLCTFMPYAPCTLNYIHWLLLLLSFFTMGGQLRCALCVSGNPPLCVLSLSLFSAIVLYCGE